MAARRGKRRRTSAAGIPTAATRGDPRHAALMEEKRQATERGEPWVAVIDAGMDNGKGRVEIDYNADFIRYIREGSGDTHKSEEEIVDQWFKGLCLRKRMEDKMLDSVRAGHLVRR